MRWSTCQVLKEFHTVGVNYNEGVRLTSLLSNLVMVLEKLCKDDSDGVYKSLWSNESPCDLNIRIYSEVRINLLYLSKPWEKNPTRKILS